MRTTPSTAAVLAALLLALALAAPACDANDGGDASFGPDPDDAAQWMPDAAAGSDLADDDEAAPDAGGPPADATGPTTAPSLDFVQAAGDDGLACAGTAYCSVHVGFDDERAIQVRYFEGGEPRPDRVVKFRIADDPDGAGRISALSAYTDHDGVASIRVQGGGSSPGRFTVQAHVDDADVPRLVFDVAVTAGGLVPLTVVGQYEGARRVDSYEVRLYRQTDGVPGCSDPQALFEGTAHEESPAAALGQTVKFLDFPGMADGDDRAYTALAYARDSQDTRDVVLAWGCDDQAGKVTPGGETVLAVPMDDRPPAYAGTYELRSRLDFGDLFPTPYDGYARPILDLLRSPTSEVLALACELREEEPTLGELCDRLFLDPEAPTMGELTLAGTAMAGVVEASLDDLAEGSAWESLLAGGEVVDLFSALEVRGTLTFDEEPGPDGAWTKEETLGAWDRVILKWPGDASCERRTDEGCEKRLLFNTVQPDAPVTGRFEAAVEGFWSLTIAEHPLSLAYGGLVDAVIQKGVLPRLLGARVEDGPTVDPYERLLASLVGGPECLAGAADPPGACCSNLSQGVGASVLGLEDAEATREMVEAACGALVTAGARYLSESLTVAGAAEAAVLATGAPCPVLDDGDLVVDGFGSPDAPCTWELILGAGGGTSTIEADFWASRPD